MYRRRATFICLFLVWIWCSSGPKTPVFSSCCVKNNTVFQHIGTERNKAATGWHFGQLGCGNAEVTPSAFVLSLSLPRRTSCSGWHFLSGQDGHQFHVFSSFSRYLSRRKNRLDLHRVKTSKSILRRRKITLSRHQLICFFRGSTT